MDNFDEYQELEWPLTILWPADTQIPMIARQWRKREDGRIEATYRSREELLLCLRFAKWTANSPSPKKNE